MITAAQLDAAQLDAAWDELTTPFVITPEMFARLPAPWISSGFYTLEHPDGSHSTWQIRLEKTHRTYRGQRTISRLIGPDNSNDYERTAVLWNSGFSPIGNHRRGRTAELLRLLWDAANDNPAEGYTLLIDKRCRWCSKHLTDPTSIRTEIGPTCRKKLGIKTEKVTA